jgi:hypothetical protein
MALTPQQSRLIAALVTGRRIKDACKKAGCSTRSYTAWRDDTEFASALQTAQRDAWARAVGSLKGLAPAAVRRLRKLLSSEREDVALKVALGLLDRGTKAVEVADLLARVEALEKKRR